MQSHATFISFFRTHSHEANTAHTKTCYPIQYHQSITSPIFFCSIFHKQKTWRKPCLKTQLPCLFTHMIYTTYGGRNSSVGSAWARCPQRCGFDPPLGTFSGRGDFSLGVNMGSNSIPPKTPSDESINRGLVCAHMHFIARTPKIVTFMS